MHISKISFPCVTNYYKQTSNNKKEFKPQNNTITPVNLNYCPTFMGSTHTYNFLPISEKAFEEQGGTLSFDRAYTPSGTPYSGRTINDTKNMQIISSYFDGKKSSINIAWSQRDDKDDIMISLKKDNEINSAANSKNVVWTNSVGDIEYIESYNQNGKLTKTSLIGYKSAYDNTVVMSVQRDFEDDGTTLYREETNVGEEFEDLFGYATRISLRTKNGLKETYYDFIDKDKTKKYMSKTVYFDKNGNKYRTEEDDVIYFNPKSGTPYAKSSKRVTFKDKAGNVKVRDYDFETTDYSQGAGPIREFMYKEYPNTIRDFQNGAYVYYNGITRKMYAGEKYKQGEQFPSYIVDFENERLAEVKNLARNTLFMNVYSENSGMTHSILSEKHNDNLTIKQIDEYYPNTNIKALTRRFNADGSVQISRYDKEGKPIDTTNETSAKTNKEES